MKKALKSATVANSKTFLFVDYSGLLSNHFIDDLRQIYTLSDVLPLSTLTGAKANASTFSAKAGFPIPNSN
jgi:hypothetical protein